MLSMITLGTAYAERFDAFCSPRLNQAPVSHVCNSLPVMNDHIHFVLLGGGVCGAIVTDVSQLTVGLIEIQFMATHGFGFCENFVGQNGSLLIPGTI